MDERLDAVLAELVARSGAQAARAVDARTGRVLAQVGANADEDVTTLVRLARDAVPAAAAGGGMEDLVLATRRGVHVLRSLPGAFLHLRTAEGPGVAAARRELASPRLHLAVDVVLRGPDVPMPNLPHPRRADAGPSRQPALAVLAAAAGPARAGSLAVLALAPDASAPLPLRVPARPVPARAVLQQHWAGDADTMRRVLEGLRRLN